MRIRKPQDKDEMTKDDAMVVLAEKYVPAIYKRALNYIEEHGEADAYEIAEACHCAVATAQEALRTLRLTYRCIRPSSWHRRVMSGPPYPKFEIGSGKGVAAPAKKTNSEKSRSWRLKQRLKAGMPTMLETANAAR